MICTDNGKREDTPSVVECGREVSEDEYDPYDENRDEPYEGNYWEDYEAT
jgi:hypothetical protein